MHAQGQGQRKAVTQSALLILEAVRVEWIFHRHHRDSVREIQPGQDLTLVTRCFFRTHGEVSDTGSEAMHAMRVVLGIDAAWTDQNSYHDCS